MYSFEPLIFDSWGCNMTVSEILQETGQSEASILREHLLLTGLAKLTRYEAECSKFEKKYGQSLVVFKKQINKRHNEENFAAEDDLIDWEFADAALKWWRAQVEELRRAA
jgi:hypothetical protein